VGGKHPPIQGGRLALFTIAVSLAMFMNVLDTSIANVAIPTLAGDLAVSPDQGTWVITSFVVSTAIALPLAGWMGRRFGEVRLFVLSVVLFTLFSLLCGLSGSLASLIVFRVLQGAAAGLMMPFSQSLLLANYPEDKRGMALAIWSMTTVVAPVVGPVLGGWITDDYSWPWIFYINVPVGLFSAWVTWRILRGRETDTARLPIDKIGLGLLIVGVASLQILLDKGNDLDWFESDTIVTLAVVATVALTFFIAWELTERNPIVDLTLFKGLNYTVGTVALSLGYLTFFGNIVLFPLWLQTQMGYTATWAGLAASPMGLLAVVVAPIVGRNMQRFDLRLITSAGFIIFAVVSFWNASFNTDVDYRHLIMPRLLFGVGIPMFFVPLIAMSLAGLPGNRIAAASGLTNFLRQLGGSFGTSLTVTLWNRRETLHSTQLDDHITAYSPAARSGFDHLHDLGIHGLAASQAMARTVTNQAYMLAANDIFWLSGWIFLGLTAFLWLARSPSAARARAAGH
jgi:DHA2 family multidrug resistance protein